MTKVDNVIERRVLAVQLGLLSGLVVLVAGPEVADLASSVGRQSSVLLVAVVGALLVERRTRAAEQRHLGRLMRPGRPVDASTPSATADPTGRTL